MSGQPDLMAALEASLARPWYKYAGRDRNGVAHRGVTLLEPAEFVRPRYERGWRRLTVTSLATGEEVGGIGPHPDTFLRTWWADSEGAS